MNPLLPTFGSRSVQNKEVDDKMSEMGMRVYRWISRETKLLALLICLSQVSCVVVGYRSGGGWFVWPGALTLLVVVAVIFLLARRRGR